MRGDGAGPQLAAGTLCTESSPIIIDERAQLDRNQWNRSIQQADDVEEPRGDLLCNDDRTVLT